MKNVIEQEVKEVEIDCSICMEKAEIPMTYQCCKQISCKECYTKMRRQYKRKDCPFCRHKPTRALRSPLHGGVEKKKKSRCYHQFSDEPDFLIARQPIADAIKQALAKERAGFRLQKGAIHSLRMAIEQYGIERMRVSQIVATTQGKRTVTHLVM